MRAPDPRFFEDLGPATLAEVAALTGAELSVAGLAERRIARVSILAQADPEAITFLADRKYAGELATSRAGACFLRDVDADKAPPGCAVLVTPLPQAAYAVAAERLHRPRRHDPA